MNAFNLPAWMKHLTNRSVAAPVIIILLLAMMILPLPAIILDMLFSFNIALSILVLLIGLQTKKALDFIAFPTVLLVTTMLRLSLNVASTRVVLTEGHAGPDAAGKVIEAFGHFLIGGNYTVGIVVFVILTIINFTVVTKGAGRIAEVGARFTLDAMPGKQMAIDADLNAGLIGEDEARRRRSEVGQESEFYGAMDGASKYVRGDAVAGIMITIINIVGGLIVGMLQHDMAFADAVKNYTLLAIGDGLVAQIPSLIISIAAGVVVSRVANNEDIGGQLTNQLFSNARVVYITAGIIGGMGAIPGMPHLAFLILAGVLAGMAYFITEQKKIAEAEPVVEKEVENPTETEEASWDDVTPVDIVGLEVGYRLIPLVDKAQGGDLLKRIKGLRKKFAQEVGFLAPTVHIRDNLELKPSSYRITLKGVEIATGESQYGQFLAINPGMVTGSLPGTITSDPAFGLPAITVGTPFLMALPVLKLSANARSILCKLLTKVCNSGRLANSTSSSAKSNSNSTKLVKCKSLSLSAAISFEKPPFSCFKAKSWAMRCSDAIKSATASACAKSSLPFKKALWVNSPGSANLAPLSIYARNKRETMYSLPCTETSTVSSPV
jgi:flagellar biosynthesis protein FlhA